LITAVDTNVLVDVMSVDAAFGEASARLLRRCVQEGGVIASDVVWAEVAAGFSEVTVLTNALQQLGVEFVPLTRDGAELASAAWRAYRAQGGPRTRIVADFLVGGHASMQADRLLSRDRGFFRRYFSSLIVLDPAAR
jgi:predicted nucleic acid-binding protein